MKTFRQLTEEYEQAVKELEKACKHEDVGSWMPEWKGIGYSVYELRVCSICNQVVDRRLRLQP